MHNKLFSLFLSSTIVLSALRCTDTPETLTLEKLEQERTRQAGVKSTESNEIYYNAFKRDSLNGDTIRTIESYDQKGRLVGQSRTILGKSWLSGRSGSDSVIYFYDSFDRPTLRVSIIDGELYSFKSYEYYHGAEIGREYRLRDNRVDEEYYGIDSLNRVVCLVDWYLGIERYYKYDATGRRRSVVNGPPGFAQVSTWNEDLFQFKNGGYTETRYNRYIIYDIQGYLVEEYWKSDHFDRPLKRFHRYQRNEKGLPFEELIVDSAGNHISLTRYSYQYYTD